MAEVKKRIWSFLLYPENLDENWLTDLRSLQLPGFVSPLHNLDKKKNGELVKPHYHVYLTWSGPTTKSNVLSTINKVYPEINYIEGMDSLEGCWKYSDHLLQDDKVKYDSSEKICFNGFDPTKMNQLTETEQDELEDEIFTFIEEFKICEIGQLLLYCRKFNRDWYRHIRSNTYFWKCTLDSFRNGGFDINFLGGLENDNA